MFWFISFSCFSNSFEHYAHPLWMFTQQFVSRVASRLKRRDVRTDWSFRLQIDVMVCSTLNSVQMHPIVNHRDARSERQRTPTSTIHHLLFDWYQIVKEPRNHGQGHGIVPPKQIRPVVVENMKIQIKLLIIWQIANLTDSIKKWGCKLLFTSAEIHSYWSLKGSAWDSVLQE